MLLRYGLPFHDFEACLRADEFAYLPAWSVTDVVSPITPISPYSLRRQSPEIASLYSPTSTIFEIGGLSDGRLKPLRAVVFPALASRELSETSVIGPDIQLYTSPLHRQILFSVANNFAGLGAFSMEQVIQFLQNEPSQILSQMMRCASGCYTQHAIAHNLFRAAIEFGNAQIVGFILRSDIGVDVNTLICHDGRKRYTPVERASGLQHSSVVKVLLHYKADINLTYPKRERGLSGGALHYVVHFCSDYENRKLGARPDPKIFALLVEAGGKPSHSQLKNW